MITQSDQKQRGKVRNPLKGHHDENKVTGTFRKHSVKIIVALKYFYFLKLPSSPQTQTYGKNSVEEANLA